jgi:peptide/nickel transport system substrate-binding protein
MCSVSKNDPENRPARLLSRRRFLELTAAFGGVAVAAACSAPAPAPTAAPAKPTEAPKPAGAAAPAAPQASPAAAPAAAPAASPASSLQAPASAMPTPPGTGETPVPGGVFRVAFAGTPDFLDPFKSFQGESYAVTGHIYDNLTMLDADNQPLPMLATKWTPEKNAQEWVIELRQGVKWHHGKEFNADDLVTTFERGQDPKSGLRTVDAFGPYEGIKKEDTHRVRLILRQPFADFPVAAAGPQCRIAPADKADKLTEEPTGTGPFKFKEFQPGTHTILVKNPDYWMKDRPFLNELRLVTIKEAAARQAALQSGAIDAIFESTPAVHQALQNAQGVRTYSIESGSHQLVQMQANLAPFDKVEVRQAFKLLMDREPLVRSLLLGNGTIGQDHPLLASSPFYTQKPNAKRDIEQAKALLAKAGVTNLNLELWTSSERPPSEKMAVALKEQAAAAGITLEVKDVPQAVYSADVSKKKPLYTVNRFGRATLYEQIFLWYHGKAGFNYSSTQLSPKLDSLLEDMTAETDFAKRKEIVSKVLDEILVVGHHLIPYFTNYTSAQSTKINGYLPSRNLWVDARNAWVKG